MIDHSILSPGGRVSKRAEKSAKERQRKELFGDGLEYPMIEQPNKRERKLRLIREYRELAGRGMKPRKYEKLAQQLEKEIENNDTI